MSGVRLQAANSNRGIGKRMRLNPPYSTARRGADDRFLSSALVGAPTGQTTKNDGLPPARLEMQFHRELQNPRIAGGGDSAERRRTDVRVRVVQIHVVDGVERLEARFQTIPLVELDDAAERGVDAHH